MIIVRLLSPGPWLVGTTKVYSGVGADIVMESITLKTPFLSKVQHVAMFTRDFFFELKNGKQYTPVLPSCDGCVNPLTGLFFCGVPTLNAYTGNLRGNS
jgi:hypothetical protein